MSVLAATNTYKNHTASSPVGCIMQYLGKSDPDGWIICDGQTRNVSDGRFAELSRIIGGTSNSITPPDLRGKFLYGASSTTGNMGQTGGSTTQQLSTDNMPSHNHSISISDGGHSHTINMSQDAHSHSISISDPGHKHTVSASQDAHDHTVTISDPGHGHSITAYQDAHSHSLSISDPGHYSTL
jgi:microcystin-dependent protein